MQRVVQIMGATSHTYATWDPAATGSHITLSNGNLTATESTGGPYYQATRSTISKSSGKWYWELTVGGTFPTETLGICLSSFVYASNAVGLDLAGNSWSYYGNNGDKAIAGVFSSYGSSYGAGDIVGVALDAGGGSITFYKNNVSQGVAYSGLTGPFYAAVSPYALSTLYTAIVTANFGATSLTYSPPGGYNSGLYQ